MQPVLVVAVLWLLFAGTHVGLASTPVRGALVARLGEKGFGALFSGVAVASFAALVSGYAARRLVGPPGLDAGRLPAVRAFLMATIVAGVTLMFLMDYAKSPTALFDQPIRSPRGAERITRHPFFAGVTLLGLGHTLLATRLVGTMFFAGLAGLAVVGAWHQDRKLLARRGRSYAEYLAVTSAVPFVAILAGRQRMPRREIPPRAFAIGLGVALFLRTVHGSIFASGGAWVIGAVVVGAVVLALRAWRRARRLRAAVTPAYPAVPAP